ncbi:hypothetical protein BV898_05293 [Hypsibius exemplaris]|uniref:MATH domain-containing protein n=1 Tax=Hypsibius exemplaris TaxID=2072580 RepID=A0A1W0WZS0_HYPEX|nr:hypothetical protein BV898_05293 [Hypsibius exemplaris]
MVSLARFTDLRDRSQTQIFTFIVAKTILSDYHSELQSKDFFYAHQRWHVAFTKTDHHLEPSLHLHSNPSPNVMTCALDLTVILHNREHFSRNESYHVRQTAFTSDCPVHTCPTFIGLQDLLTRQFTDEQTEFIVDFVLKNPRSQYEDHIQIPIRHKGQPLERLESSYFTFGNLEWNLVMMPTASGTLVKLNRMTHFDHSCQTKFRITIGHSGSQKFNPFISPVQDSLSDLSGTGESIMFSLTLEDFVENHQVFVVLDMYSANLLSEILVPALHESVHFYDRDKQAWHLQTVTLQRGDDEYLKVKIFYDDVKQIPRDHSRYAAWKLHVRPINSPSTLKPEVLGPFCKYYQQRDVDFSFEVPTKTPVHYVPTGSISGRDAFRTNGGLPGSNGFVVLIEWLYIHLLSPSQYHHYDDLHRTQYHQMRLEFATVQAESYNLERTLLFYKHGFNPDNGESLSVSRRNSKFPPSRDGMNELVNGNSNSYQNQLQ